MVEYQRTIREPVSVSGVGLHTGAPCTITFHPAQENYGYRFVRTDVPNAPEIPALVDYVVDATRWTTLGSGDVRVHTVEHVLAALAGLRIDNCRIELDASEPPVGDGSSLPFVEALLKAGIMEQRVPRDYLIVDHPIRYTDETRGTDMVALPNDDFRITVMIDYPTPALGSQHTGLFSLEKEFVTEFAPARTFCLLSEVESLLEQGLIRGGSLDNAIVIVDRAMSPEGLRALARRLGIEGELRLGSNGILNDTPLRYKNEPARHKLLDLLGDLALVGVPLRAHILAARPGHATNVEFARRIRRLYEQKQLVRRYQVRPSEGAVFDIEAILRIMPHRYPFLLVDRIVEYDLENNRILGYKNVTFNEPFFQGHFPGRPVMPGVLIVEAMAQTGCLLLLKDLALDPERVLVFFTGIDKARFRRPVVPGDQLFMEVRLLHRRFKTVLLEGKAFVNEQLAAQAELQAAIVER
ncbi:MAG: bifunctional UDP-3-O-[3-hydroxymyristoyl] N-acetylglucosamine deacetylase/3-hydroxyacyl-ACP dehydratase [Chlorobiota bacterium]